MARLRVATAWGLVLVALAIAAWTLSASEACGGKLVSVDCVGDSCVSYYAQCVSHTPPVTWFQALTVLVAAGSVHFRTATPTIVFGALTAMVGFLTIFSYGIFALAIALLATLAVLIVPRGKADPKLAPP